MAYTDSFTDDDGTTLTDHDAAWVTVTTDYTAAIYSNQVNGGSGTGAYYYNQAANSKHYAKLTYVETAGPEYIGPAIRVQSGDNYYYCLAYHGDKIYNGECISSSLTDWDSGLTAPEDNDILELWVDATTETTIICKNNGATIETYTSKSALSGGKYGLCGNYVTNSPKGDNWEGGNVVAAGVSKPIAMHYYRQRRTT